MTATKTTPAERAATITTILGHAIPVLADPDSPPDAVARCRDALRTVTTLIDNLHGIEPQTSVKQKQAEPRDARARAREETAVMIARLERSAEREAAGLHHLRKGRHQCDATTRDGGRCQAPAIPGGNVCRRHGGGAPQVRVQAALTVLYEARYEAGQAVIAAKGSPGEFDALCAWSKADNAVQRAEEKVDRIRELRAELRRRKATPP